MTSSPATLLEDARSLAGDITDLRHRLHREPELGVAVTEGRRREFSRMGWDLEAVPDPQDHATFEAATLRWTSGAHADDYDESFADFGSRVQDALGVGRDAAPPVGPRRRAHPKFRPSPR